MTSICYTRIGALGAPPVVFLHGWGRTGRDFIPVAEALSRVADCYLLDLPGFGRSPRPEAAWSTVDYAHNVVSFCSSELGIRSAIWVGHSFGARIGLRAAANTPENVSSLVVVAGAGIKRKVSFYQKVRSGFRSRQFKFLRNRAGTEEELLALEGRYGSPDYVASRTLGLRDIFLKTISEDQTPHLAKIKCPTVLLYGGRDTETPPEIGKRISAAVPKSRYVECPEYDHISILDRGRHQIALTIKRKLKNLEC
ncbi:alpha/beta fold hydrolase [Rhodovulum sp. ES.010]|uniref:alpha/beta fold hydrolase n=1 Tax=Rhodovulum sp. ES.010 TaxID=1882821 RepID=UPI00094180C0|nr:alpha/beta hydrolase [Rhodovulum sp. ES.010]